jgi:uncharacterized membrane protein
VSAAGVAQPALSMLRHRVVVFGGAIVAGALVALFAPAWLHATVRAVATYDAAALAMLIASWTFSLRDDAQHTSARSAQEDPGRNVVLAIVLASIVFGFASAVVIFGKGPDVPAADHTVALVVGLAAVVLGWLLIHTTFIFRYAHLFYYDDDGDGVGSRGLQFPGTTDPDDYDFAYFSFVIGMTFQVSDVQVTDPAMRRFVLLHGLISFAYNTAIVALVVNLASGLFSSH